MEEINMSLKYRVPRFGFFSSSKPFCIGYNWSSEIIDLTSNLWIYLSLHLEDYSRYTPRFLQVVFSYIPKDKEAREKIRQCYLGSHEECLYGMSVIYNLGLFRKEKRLGLIEFQNGEQKSSLIPFADQEHLLNLFNELIGTDFFMNNSIAYNQLDHSICNDARFTQNKKLALKRLLLKEVVRNAKNKGGKICCP